MKQPPRPLSSLKRKFWWSGETADVERETVSTQYKSCFIRTEKLGSHRAATWGYEEFLKDGWVLHVSVHFHKIVDELLLKCRGKGAGPRR